MCIAAMHLAEAPGFFVRIIPTAKSLFAIVKLNLNRNNVRVLNHGGVFSSVLLCCLLHDVWRCLLPELLTVIGFFSSFQRGYSSGYAEV